MRESERGKGVMPSTRFFTAGPEMRTRTSMLLRQALQGVCEDGGTELQPRARASLPWHPIARLDRESPRLTLFPRVMPPLNRSPPHTTCGLHLEGYRRSSSRQALPPPTCGDASPWQPAMHACWTAKVRPGWAWLVHLLMGLIHNASEYRKITRPPR